MANAFQGFAMASVTSEDHQALAGRLVLPKRMAEVAASLRSLVKVWVASERKYCKVRGGRAVGII